ncbi:major facilitator superfamily transporter [Biscogniauxia mediterranea]|nr:major facilitator superfamily transporter [Biscogniauxia mediterranea]
MAMVGEERHVIDPVVAARAVRKIDWCPIPAMTVGCSAALFGMTTDLHLSVAVAASPDDDPTVDTSWATSIFYGSGRGGCWAPSRVPLWGGGGGLVCMLTAAAAATSHRGQRFALGFVERALCPPLRSRPGGSRPTGLWTGALNYGFFAQVRTRAGATTLRPWQQTGVRCPRFKGAQLRDVKTWLLAAMMASAYTVNGARWSALDSVLFQFPLGGLCLVVVLLTGWLGSRYPGYPHRHAGRNIIGPQLIRSQTKVYHYPELWLGLIICYCITIVSAVALFFVLRHENQRKQAAVVVEDETERARLAFQDLFDKENPYFRYAM